MESFEIDMSERYVSTESYNNIPDVRTIFDMESISNPKNLAGSLFGLAGKLSKLSDQEQTFAGFLGHGEREERLALGFQGFAPEEDDDYMTISNVGYRVQKSSQDYLKSLDELPIKEIITVLHSWAIDLDPDVSQIDSGEE